MIFKPCAENEYTLTYRRKQLILLTTKKDKQGVLNSRPVPLLPVCQILLSPEYRIICVSVSYRKLPNIK